MMNLDLFKTMCDVSSAGMILIRWPELKVVYSNQKVSEMLDLSEGFKVEQLFDESHQDSTKGLNKELLEKETFFDDIRILKMTGETLNVSLEIKKLHFKKETFHLLLIQDMTYTRKLQELDQAKDKFVALITHELRTPLSAIVATADFLSMKCYETEEQLHEFLKLINNEGQHLMEMVNDILDISKIKTGKIDFYIEESDPSGLITTQVNNFKKMADANDVRIRYLRSSEKLLCFFDPIRLNQIVSNILSNAIKFSRPGTEVQLTLRSDEQFVILRIEDQGKGIPDAFKEKVFDEFETIENIKSHHKGTGLGMPISKRLIEGMGGKIWFESQEGVGTTFYLEIPRTKVLAEELYRVRPSTDNLAA